MIIKNLLNKYTLFFISVFAVVGLIAPTASAASPYDDIVRNIDSLNIYQDGFDPYGNINVTYTAIMDEKCTSRYESFQNALNNPDGKWQIVWYDWGTYSSVSIYWTEDNSDTSRFRIPFGTQTMLSTDYTEAVSLYQFNNTGMRCDSLGDNGTVDIYPIPQQNPESWMFLSTYPITYPDAYEGEIIPETQNPVIPSNETPNWYTSDAVDYLVNIHDTNFNTFDGNPFLCQPDDLAPVLYWTIYNNTTNVQMATGVQSATSQINFQASKNNTLTEYRIEGYYDCGGDPIFTELGIKIFSINQYGMLDNKILDDCLIPDFPFIDMNGCLNNVYAMIGLLSFNSVKFGNVWQTSDSCYNLVILDDWINLSNPTICPQFPSSVRNIITPFVTFILGIITIGFIVKRKDRND